MNDESEPVRMALAAVGRRRFPNGRGNGSNQAAF